MLRTTLLSWTRRQCAPPILLRHILRPLSTSVWAATTAGQPTGVATSNFPHWLHLKATAPYGQRVETTDQIAHILATTTGGYLTHSTMLSDVETTLVLEDVDPQQLENFHLAVLSNIPGLAWHPTSQTQLQHCIELIQQVNHEHKSKAHHITSFEQSLHDLERDGFIETDQERDLLRQCHQLAQQLSAKNPVSTDQHMVDGLANNDDDLGNNNILPPTVNAILQVQWKDVAAAETKLPQADAASSVASAWPWTDG